MYMKIQLWDTKYYLICSTRSTDLQSETDHKLLTSYIILIVQSSTVLNLRILEIPVKIHNSAKVKTVQLVKGIHKIKELKQQI